MYETIEDEDVIKVKKIYVSSKKILSFNKIFIFIT